MKETPEATPAPTPSVAEEINQSRPFPTAGQELVVSLLRTADEVRQYMESILEPEDVTLQQYNVLRILRGAGPTGLATLEIGRRMVEKQPGVTRLVDRLVKKALVDRSQDPEDRRRMLCTLTPEGLELLARLDLRVSEADARFRAGLTPEILQTLIQLLGESRVALRAGHL